MAKRQTKNKRKRSVLAPSPPQMVILRVCMVLLALLLAAITLLNRGSDTVMNTAYPRKYDEYVTYYAGKYQIDPYILYSIIRTESNFNPQAESNVGARGLMQITEITFDWIKTKIAPDEPLTFDDLYDPEVNIRFGSYFISYCLHGMTMTWPPPQPPTTAGLAPWIPCWRTASIRRMARYWMLSRTRKCAAMCKK